MFDRAATTTVRGLLRPALVAAAAVAAWSLAPSTARASCGDYVHVAPATGDDARTPTPNPAPPCHGPNCTGGHDHAPLLPVVTTRTHVDPVAWLPAVVDAPPAAGTDPVSLPVARTPLGRSPRVERPPRL